MHKAATNQKSTFCTLFLAKTLLLFIFYFSSLVAGAQVEEAITTIIVLRHAEKADQPDNPDPDLSDEGNARAEKIAALFAEDTIDAVYTTSYKRTKQTITPLATSQNLMVKEYPPADEESFADILSRHKGEKIVICGHSNTVPILLNYFTESTAHAALQEDEYDKIFIISKSTSGKSATLKLSLSTN